ncbi:MAG: UDP-N-acetylmuramate--L-alanine ligase [Candidatus Sericytochromatia bacterium]|nr:UDP-N-acetylmuramate--L-alanine ligase [Candidatus Sericytochromatia bacterium]
MPRPRSPGCCFGPRSRRVEAHVTVSLARPSLHPVSSGGAGSRGARHRHQADPEGVRWARTRRLTAKHRQGHQAVTPPPALHFVGIGGVGMSAIAQVWHCLGRPVSGSDQAPSTAVQRLLALGIQVRVGHAAEHLGPDVEGLVVSTAVKQDNPELQEAVRRGLPVFHRSQVLGALMAQKRSIAVTGTHGKTTTTAMVASILIEGKLDPTVLLGGELPELGGNARHGHGEHLVAEADESDKSITNLSAETVILTNLEGDHLEHYRDLDEIIEVVATFLNQLPDGARLVACADCPGVARLLEHVALPVATYGFSPVADYIISGEQLTAGGSTFTVRGTSYALQVPGRHNISNAAAALVACDLAGVPTEAIRAGLASFTGVKRRFQTIGSVDGVTVVDDYAHHPSEIKATLSAAALLGRPVHAVFQPHRHSRLEALLNDFAASFRGARTVTIMDTYGAGEAPRAVDASSLAALVSRQEPGVPVTHAPTLAAAVTHLVETARPGDLVVLLGAGDIHLVAQPLLSAFEHRTSVSVQSA